MTHEDSGDAMLNRRTFLSTGIAVGAVLASGITLAFAKPAAAALASSAHGVDGTGHVDDACGHWPPYSHPIPYGYASPVEFAWEHWDAIDHNFMI